MSDLNNLMTKTRFFALDQVFVGNGKGLSIHQIGHTSFSSPFVPSKSLASKAAPICSRNHQNNSRLEPLWTARKLREEFIDEVRRKHTEIKISLMPRVLNSLMSGL